MNHGAQHETTSERLMTNAEDIDNPFLLDVKTRSYKHQYSNIYFTRLHQLKAIIQGVADSKWKTIPGIFSVGVPANDL
jgi:DNA polymerase II small subunit/DNA polymerase delta subunit B